MSRKNKENSGRNNPPHKKILNCSLNKKYPHIRCADDHTTRQQKTPTIKNMMTLHSWY